MQSYRLRTSEKLAIVRQMSQGAGSATETSCTGHHMVHARKVFTVYLKRTRAQTAAAGGFLDSQIRDIQNAAAENNGLGQQANMPSSRWRAKSN